MQLFSDVSHHDILRLLTRLPAGPWEAEPKRGPETLVGPGPPAKSQFGDSHPDANYPQKERFRNANENFRFRNFVPSHQLFVCDAGICPVIARDGQIDNS